MEDIPVKEKKTRNAISKAIATKSRKYLSCSPLPIAYLWGTKYFLFFVNDYSKKTWIYFLKKKKKNLWKIHIILSNEERQTEKLIKGLKTDNRKKIILQDFLNYYTRNGTIWQFILSYILQ